MKYYFIGIKGSGMSALALILHDQGNHVSGCDTSDFLFTQKLLDQKKISIDSFENAAPEGIDCFVIGNAFINNSELIDKITSKSISSKNISYIKLLSELSVKHKSFAVSGSHGKTTTTGLLATTMSPNFPISCLIGDGTGFSSPSAETFVFEACEYKGHFSTYKPDIAIITNIDFDHPDYFQDLEHVQEEFIKFSENVDTLIINADDNNSQLVYKSKKIVTFAINNEADYRATNIKASKNGYSFDLIAENRTISFNIPFFGIHMIYNSLSVIAASRIAKISFSKIQNSIVTFKGVDRRFTQYDFKNDGIIIDDYAHHPMEIEATIKSVRQKFPNRRVVAVHQPHTFSRTNALLHDFAKSFNLADESHILPIWGSVREKNKNAEISELDLIKLINNSHSFEYNKVLELINEKNVVVFMSASDIQPIITQMIEEKNE
jgi:UDP-N-acetylmuramate--alanine ligase